MSVDLKPSSKGSPLAAGGDVSDRIIDWTAVLAFLFLVFVLGAAVGSMQTVEWMTDEINTRFDCVEK